MQKKPRQKVHLWYRNWMMQFGKYEAYSQRNALRAIHSIMHQTFDDMHLSKKYFKLVLMYSSYIWKILSSFITCVEHSRVHSNVRGTFDVSPLPIPRLIYAFWLNKQMTRGNIETPFICWIRRKCLFSKSISILTKICHIYQFLCTFK